MTMFGDDAKVGDKVYLLHYKSSFNSSNELSHARDGRIEKLTKTQVTTLGGRRFNRQHGREIGKDKWHPDHLVPRTEDIEALINHTRKVHLAVKSCRQVAEYLRRAHGSAAIAARKMISGDLVSLAYGTKPPQITETEE